MLLLQVFNQLLVLPLDFFQVVLLQLELAHLRPVAVLRISKLDTLWLDETMNRVILLHLNDPVAKALCRLRGVRHFRWLEVGVVKELALHFGDDIDWDVVLVVVLQLA